MEGGGGEELDFHGVDGLPLGQGHDFGEDVEEDFGGGLGGVDLGDAVAVVVEHGFGLGLVGGESALDNGFAGVVEAVVFEGALAQAAGELGAVGAGKVKELEHIDVVGHVFGLFAIAGDAVEHEEIDLGFEDVGFDAVFDVGLPELDGEVIGHEFAAAGVLDEFLAQGSAGVEGAKDISAGEVMEAGYVPEDLALGAFAAAGGTKDEQGLEAGECLGVGHDGVSLSSVGFVTTGGVEVFLRGGAGGWRMQWVSKMVADEGLIEVRHPRGIYLPEADLWLDPHFGVGRAFVSHAHADHVARHGLTFCSALTERLMRSRFGLKAEAKVRALAWREPLEWEGWQLRVVPAGHIVGSAMLHLTRLRDGATLLYTGDYKLRQGLSAEKAELLGADTLIMETTFGLPHYVFPPIGEVVGQVLKWVRETLDEGGIPVLLGYSLGKAQEILCALAGLGVPVMLHAAVWKMTEELRDVLGPLPEMKPFDVATAAGHVLVFPPSAARAQALRKLKVCRTAMLSGWALQSGAKYRYQVDEAFPLSDHADYPELVQTVEEVRPKRVYLVHGSVREFAADLRRRGFDARALGMVDQFELGLVADAGSEKVEEVASEVAEADAGAVNGFGRWVTVCEAAAGESSRLKKQQVLAQWFRELGDEDLMVAVRLVAGHLVEPGSVGGGLQVGWALVRRVLVELAGCSEAEYRAVSRTQNDAGRTAFLMLKKRREKVVGEAGEEWTLAEVAAFFAELRALPGALAKAEKVKARLAKMGSREGSWLVRLLTGDLRMGAKEGLVEEAVALAFGQPVEAVREAMMLGGDPGRAAQLARAGRLDEAVPQVFVPIKVMLASPEETAEAIWGRVEEGGETVAWVEDKFDGIRAQVHGAAGRVEIFTRDMKRITEQFPEVVASLAGLSEAVILDGEIIAFAEDKKLSFFDLQKRLGRRDQADLFVPSAVTVRYVVFDVLFKGGKSLLRKSLKERRLELEALALPKEGVRRVEVVWARSALEVEAAFLAARGRGNEGLIVKAAASSYAPGRRGKAWLKLKKAFATLDVVVVRVEQGHGKRSHLLSDYTFAVRETESGALRVIGKAYSGLTDAEIEELTQVFLEQTIETKGRQRVVVPQVVLEIAFDSIQASTRHDSGLALRFPRIKAIRLDKTAEEIDTLEDARKLAGVDGG